jgi:hypothetical protein
MANAIYPTFKAGALRGTANFDLDDAEGVTGVYCALVDTGTYTYSAAHDFYNDLSGVVGTDQEILSKTQASGTFDGTDLTYTSVSGNSVEALVLYRKNAGANTTWALILYEDTSVTGLPVTPNGGNITVTWNASGIFTISDRRMKENIEEIGHLDGVLPIYRYSYLGEECFRTGLMAQDVEKVVPEAVMDFGAFKAVDYNRCIEAVQTWRM